MEFPASLFSVFSTVEFGAVKDSCSWSFEMKLSTIDKTGVYSLLSSTISICSLHGEGISGIVGSILVEKYRREMKT